MRSHLKPFDLRRRLPAARIMTTFCRPRPGVGNATRCSFTNCWRCDIRAAEVFRPLYEQLRRRDGRESGSLAVGGADTQSTMEQASGYGAKSGGTTYSLKSRNKEGVPAIRQLISEESTSTSRCCSPRDVRTGRGGYSPGWSSSRRAAGMWHAWRVWRAFSSAASIPPWTPSQERLRGGGRRTIQAAWLLGKVAIANAKLAYQTYKEIVRSQQRRNWLAKAAAQRLLWASTSTKNPSYRDVLYVEELIGPDTINTMPPATMDAFRDHGRVPRSKRTSRRRARSWKPWRRWAYRCPKLRRRCSMTACSSSASRSSG